MHLPTLDVASLTQSPPSFCGPCIQGHPRCFSCSVSSPGSYSALLPCRGLPAPCFLPPRTMLLTSPSLLWMNLCQSIQESTLICLSGKGIDCKAQLTQQKKMLNRPDIIGLGTEPFPGARNLQAASLGHGHQMPRICDTLPPCPSAQDSGSEERSPGRLCGRQQTFSPSAGTRG